MSSSTQTQNESENESENLVVLFLNDLKSSDVSKHCIKALRGVLSENPGRVVISTQGDNLFSAYEMYNEMGIDQKGVYVAKLWQRQRRSASSSTTTLTTSSPKKKFYGPSNLMLNTYDFALSSCHSFQNNDNNNDNHNDKEDSMMSTSTTSISISTTLQGDSQILPEKGELHMIDSLIDQTYHNKSICIFFGEDPPVQVNRDYHTVVCDPSSKSSKKAIISNAEPLKNSNAPSSSRRSRRFKTALKNSNLRVLKKHQKDFVRFCNQNHNHDQNQSETGENSTADGSVDLPIPLVRLFGTYQIENFSKEDGVLYKRIVSLRKKRDYAPPSKRQRTDEDGSAKTRTGGIHKKKPVTPELRDFLINKCGFPDSDEGFSRVDVSRAFPKYVKEHNLGQGKQIKMDKTLKALLNPTKGEEVTYFKLQKLVTPLFV